MTISTLTGAVEEFCRSLLRAGMQAPEAIMLSSFDEGVKLCALAVPPMAVNDGTSGWEAKPGFSEMKIAGMLFRWPLAEKHKG